MVTFEETAKSKEELDFIAKQGFNDYTNKKITKNDFLMFFGFTHANAILTFYPEDNYKVLTNAGLGTGK